jgi:hypothetical protein
LITVFFLRSKLESEAPSKSTQTVHCTCDDSEQQNQERKAKKNSIKLFPCSTPNQKQTEKVLQTMSCGKSNFGGFFFSFFAQYLTFPGFQFLYFRQTFKLETEGAKMCSCILV